MSIRRGLGKACLVSPFDNILAHLKERRDTCFVYTGFFPTDEAVIPFRLAHLNHLCAHDIDIWLCGNFFFSLLQDILLKYTRCGRVPTMQQKFSFPSNQKILSGDRQRETWKRAAKLTPCGPGGDIDRNPRNQLAPLFLTLPGINRIEEQSVRRMLVKAGIRYS